MTRWENNSGEGVVIVIIDSGASSHKSFEIQPEGIHIYYKDNKIVIENECEDTLGHGTAIYGIISKSLKDAKIINIRLFNNLFYLDDIEIMLYVLNYIYENIECNIINMSLGVCQSKKQNEFEEIINKLYQKGVIMVSSFHNIGCISMPACFKNVIGVDSDPKQNSTKEFTYLKNSLVEIIGKGMPQRIHWLNDSYMIDSGSSYATAHITVILAKLLQMNKRLNLIQIRTMLYEIAHQKKCIQTSKLPEKPLFRIERAIIFPLNKEMHALIRYHELLDFQIIGIYSSKYLGNINKTIDKVLQDISELDIQIKNINKLEWDDDFDTVILGHTDKLVSMIGDKEVKNIIDDCISYNKNLFCFDDNYKEYYLSKGGSYNNYYCSFIDDSNVPKENMGKMYKINAPVLGVFGTDSSQGKFSLQLLLRKKFLKEGYFVGQIGTEPTSILFGFDQAYPMGYNGNVKINGGDAIITLNALIHHVDLENPDIIIAGCQSGTKPDYYFNINNLNMQQQDFLLGTYPDTVLLCVSGYQSVDFVKDNIRYIESIANCNIIGIVLYPFKKKMEQGNYSYYLQKMKKEEIHNFIKNIENTLNIPSYNLLDKNDMDHLYKQIICNFSD